MIATMMRRQVVESITSLLLLSSPELARSTNLVGAWKVARSLADVAACEASGYTFKVETTPVNFTDALTACPGGFSLAIIFDAQELTAARAAIMDAGVTKAITSAVSDGSGWQWYGVGIQWTGGSFPMNTGQVIDASGGAANHMYSLHASNSTDPLIWDADMKSDQHPVLCRGPGMGTGSGICMTTVYDLPGHQTVSTDLCDGDYHFLYKGTIDKSCIEMQDMAVMWNLTNNAAYA